MKQTQPPMPNQAKGGQQSIFGGWQREKNIGGEGKGRIKTALTLRTVEKGGVKDGRRLLRHRHSYVAGISLPASTADQAGTALMPQKGLSADGSPLTLLW